VFTVESKWRPNKPLEALNCYATTSIEHPAVQVSSAACVTWHIRMADVRLCRGVDVHIFVSSPITSHQLLLQCISRVKPSLPPRHTTPHRTAPPAAAAAAADDFHGARQVLYGRQG
jgi:hypothetical protein